MSKKYIKRRIRRKIRNIKDKLGGELWMFHPLVKIGVLVTGLGSAVLIGSIRETDIKGRVVEEGNYTLSGQNYVEGQKYDSNSAEGYFFSMDTKFGRKTVRIKPTRETSKKSLDNLIDPGMLVKVEVGLKDRDDSVYNIPASKIEILEKPEE